jgi:Tfp pilus assembly protein PilE
MDIRLLKWRKRIFVLFEVTLLLTLVVLLPAFAYPRILDTMEKLKASEAFKILDEIAVFQQRYHSLKGTYAYELKDLGIKIENPKHFSLGSIEFGDSGSLENSWSLTLTRVGKRVQYGEYTVTFTNQGFDPTNSTISDIPSINPA